jgi:hypothetical protein
MHGSGVEMQVHDVCHGRGGAIHALHDVIICFGLALKKCIQLSFKDRNCDAQLNFFDAGSNYFTRYVSCF